MPKTPHYFPVMFENGILKAKNNRGRWSAFALLPRGHKIKLERWRKDAVPPFPLLDDDTAASAAVERPKQVLKERNNNFTF